VLAFFEARRHYKKNWELEIECLRALNEELHTENKKLAEFNNLRAVNEELRTENKRLKEFNN